MTSTGVKLQIERVCTPQRDIDDEIRGAAVPCLDDWMQAWAAVTRARREELGITQAELARRLRTSRPNAARMEAATRCHPPRWGTVVDLARALELGVAELVRRVEAGAGEVEGSEAG